MSDQLLSIRGLRVNVRRYGKKAAPALVFLHGFTGSVKTWESTCAHLVDNFQLIAIDLIGHGKTAVPTDVTRYSMEEQVRDLESIFNQLGLEAFTLIGYSMGGRIALGYTIQYPSRVQRLILESASPGLQSITARTDRQAADEKLAQKIEKEGVANFVEFWESIPLFESQQQLPFEVRQAIREERLTQETKGLANSLLGIGTGSQPNYWEQLSTIECPVILITGQLDQKFVGISQEMAQSLKDVQEIVVEKVGHAIHVENPSAFATIIKEALLR